MQERLFPRDPLFFISLGFFSEFRMVPNAIPGCGKEPTFCLSQIAK
jgi:hypothetical protein